MIVALAALPVAAWALAGLVLARRAGLPGAMLAFAFLWGAVGAAPLAGWPNELAQRQLVAGAHAAAGGSFVVLVAPVVEEACKGLVLLLLPLLPTRPRARVVVTGIALGAASGLGFAATENVGYLTVAVLQGGLPGLLQAAWARGLLAGVKHATFTASAGAGLALALCARSRGLAIVSLVAGGAAAVLQHVAWNGVAAPLLHELLCDAPAPGGACAPAAGPLPLLVLAPLLVVAALGPGIVVLVWLFRHARHEENPLATAPASAKVVRGATGRDAAGR